MFPLKELSVLVYILMFLILVCPLEGFRKVSWVRLPVSP
jgi:hypothetical protein